MSVLPSEIFLSVFYHLSYCGTSEDLARVGRVCWQFHAFVSPLLYYTVIADNERYLDSLHSAILRDQAKGTLIRHLVLPRLVPIAARDEDSGEYLWWIDLHVTILLACPCLESLDISPTSEEMVAAIPWAPLRRLSFATTTAAVLRSVMTRCDQIEHLNLVELDALMANHGDVLADPTVIGADRQPKLAIVSAEWLDPDAFDRVEVSTRVVEFTRRLLELPSLQRILIVRYARPMSIGPFTSVRGADTRQAAAFDLLCPLKTSKVFMANTPWPARTWTRALAGIVSYDELGDQMRSVDDIA